MAVRTARRWRLTDTSRSLLALGAAAALGSALLTPGAASAAVPPPPPTPPLITTYGSPGCAPGSTGCGLALVYPSGGAVDESGNLYTADTANGQIEAWDGNGNLLWRVGQSATNKKSLGQFLQPRDLGYVNAAGFTGLNGQGLIYVADLGNNRVDVLNAADGSIATVNAGWTTRFTSIIGISAGVDSRGNPIILATDSVATPVREFTPGGQLIATVGLKCSGLAGQCPPSQLLAPRDAATDSAGDVYVADYTNDRIVEFGASDLSTAIRTWGGRGTGQLQFNRPYGVTLDDSGNVYVADSGNNRIQEYDVSAAAPAAPTYLATYGSPTVPTGTGKFISLRRVEVSHGPNPTVYGFDVWGNAVDEFAQPPSFPGTGALSLLIGGNPAPGGAFNSPYGVAVGGGEVFIADTNNQRIQAFGQMTNSYLYNFGVRGFGETNLGFNWPRDVAYSALTNTVWVADTKNFRVTEFSLAGVATGRVIGKSGVLNWPYAVATYNADVLIADTVNNRVQLWDPTNPAAPIWSSDTLFISMKQPRALALGADLNNPLQTDVYVADSLDNRILVLNADSGALLNTIAPLSAGKPVLHRIEGLAIDPRNGHIWVSDTSWNRLVELSADGSTLLTTFGKQGTVNGQFDYPAHLAIASPDGTSMSLYVADTWNNRVQVYDITNF